MRAFTWTPSPPGELVPIVVSLADKARREGLLTLEDAGRDVDDDFLKRGVSLAVDGTDPEELREILESEVIAKKASDKHAAKFFNDMGGYAPTDRHHRHGHGARARAGEPLAARQARPPDRRRVRRDPVGRA